MTAKDSANLAQLELTVDHCKKENDAYVSLPGFSATVNVLDAKLQSIRANELEIKTEEQKFALTAKKAKAIMADHASKNAAFVRAYAGQHRDYSVPSIIARKPYKLLRLRQTAIADSCTAILSICEDLSAELLPYGFTDAQKQASAQSIEDFKTKLIKTPKFIAKRKAMNKKSHDQIAEAEDFATNSLDTLVELIAERNPLLHEQYFTLRKGWHPPVHHISMKGTVADSITKLLLRGVKATIQRIAFADGTVTTGDDAVKFFKSSTKKGVLQLKSMPSGTYTITVVKAGYAVQTITVYVNDQEMTTFEINLVKL